MEGTFRVIVEFPALERLCAVLEKKPASPVRVETAQKPVEIPAKAEKTAEKAAETEQKPKAKPEPKPEPVPEPAPEPEPKAAPVTIEAVQRAAAAMRDAGKLDAVKALFPEFGIRKLSDLTGDAVQAFAGKLREMGASL